MNESDNSCRLCLNDFDETFLSIFSNSTSDGPSLSTKIMICLALPIEPTTSFSTKICKNCSEEITRFYDFRDKCLRTHYSLSRSYKDSNNREDCFTKVEKPDEIIPDRDPALAPDDDFQETSRNPGSMAPKTNSSQRFLHPLPNESVSTPKNQLEETPDIRQDPTISLKTESESTIYEYKCLHCNNSFSDLDAASIHCMECSISREGRNLPSEDITNTTSKDQRPESERKRVPPDPQESSAISSNQSPKKIRPEKATVECSECNTKFSSASLLKRHMPVHTGERPFACETCNRRFSQMGQLNFHRKFHDNPRYRCKFCEKPFLRPSDVEKHMRTHTGEKPFTCEICDKSFAQLVALKQHERVHTGDKPYSCEICGKRFSQKANKTKHLKIHKEGTKPHTCGVCGRSFYEHEEMVLHRAGHGGGKPRKCDQCDERFRKLSELTDHVRRYHTFERPHKCVFCSKAFYSLYNLKQHVMIHTGQRPYPCAMCELKFTQKGNLAKHYERKHKNRGSSLGEDGKIENNTIND
ncbi:zinc finger protein 260 [Diachasma alloeum]|uniref:zinc finger protein 260 n=1 Tax=Diachasma alloeum TaxID=454923 RepID=UPI000738414E|nr:zinc finger protein 260 [Diachasma alloeum]